MYPYENETGCGYPGQNANAQQSGETQNRTPYVNAQPAGEAESGPYTYANAQRTGETGSPYSYTNVRPAGETRYPYVSAQPQRPKKKRTGLKVAALALCCSLLGGAVGAAAVAGLGGRTAGDTVTLTQSSREPATVEIAHVPAGEALTAAEVYAANVNSTVGVTTTAVTTNFFGFRTASAASGSGFIISEDGYIVTNYHVIEDSTSISVATYDGRTFDATLVGVDESNDLAVLKIEADGLTPVVMGDSDALNVGDDVVAIGNPLGELTFSLTKGSVSALNREVTLSSGVTMDLIQTDAAINSGNSGGALFNMYGEVVGITNAKYSSSGSSSEASIDNIGFAIPLNGVKSIIKSIIETGSVVKPYIGIEVKDASDAALVYSVEKDGPADRAGLQTNDIITAANGEKISGEDELKALVKTLEPGDTLTLTVLRGGSETDVTVTVGGRTQSAEAQQQTQSADPYGGYGRSDPYGGSGQSGSEDFWEQFGSTFGFFGDASRG